MGESFTLTRVSTKDDKVQQVADNIGRCIARIPGKDQLSFVHKKDEKEWWLQSLDLKTNQTANLIQTRAGSEDYVWMKDGSLLMGEGSVLYRWRKGKDWEKVADLKDFGLPAFYRIALNADETKLALVAYNGERP